MSTDTRDKRQLLPEALLTLSVVAVLAYTVMDLLSVRPVLIRALSPLFGS